VRELISQSVELVTTDGTHVAPPSIVRVYEPLMFVNEVSIVEAHTTFELGTEILHTMWFVANPDAWEAHCAFAVIVNEIRTVRRNNFNVFIVSFIGF